MCQASHLELLLQFLHLRLEPLDFGLRGRAGGDQSFALMRLDTMGWHRGWGSSRIRHWRKWHLASLHKALLVFSSPGGDARIDRAVRGIFRASVSHVTVFVG